MTDPNNPCEPWIDRCRNLENTVNQMKQHAAARDEVMSAAGIKFTPDGGLEIDYEKFVSALGEAQAGELLGVFKEKRAA